MAFGTRSRPHPLLVGILGVIVGIGFGIGTYQYWQRDQGLRDHGRESGATVVEVSGSGKGRKVFVEFSAEGRSVRSKVEGRMQTRGKVGDTFPVRYDERRPERDVYDARVKTQGRLLFLLVPMTVFALVGFPIIAVVEARRRRRAGAAGPARD